MLNRYLLAASFNGQTERVCTLLEKKAEINCTDHNRSSPLILAVRKGHKETVKALLVHGANVDYQIPYSYPRGNTALKIAIVFERLSIVCDLLDHKADINYSAHENFINYTPLMVAAEVGNIKIVEELLEGGADINYKISKRTGGFKSPRTAQSIASAHDHKDIAKMIKEHAKTPSKEAVGQEIALFFLGGIRETKRLRFFSQKEVVPAQVNFPPEVVSIMEDYLKIPSLRK